MNKYILLALFPATLLANQERIYTPYDHSNEDYSSPQDKRIQSDYRSVDRDALQDLYSNQDKWRKSLIIDEQEEKEE